MRKHRWLRAALRGFASYKEAGCHCRFNGCLPGAAAGWRWEKLRGTIPSQPCSGEISSKNLASDMGFMADFLNKGSFPPGIMESEEANPRLQDKMGGRWREHAKVNPKPSDIIN